MGLEADCTVRIGKKAFLGRAYLEGETLLFRGDTRLEIPFDQMRDVTADGDALVVRTDAQESRFEVGPVIANRWARLIKEPKGLFEKLEITPQSRVAVVHVTDAMFLLALRERTSGLAEGRVPTDTPIVFFGVESHDALRKLQLLRARMMDNGVLWIVRPKGSKALPEGDVFAAIHAVGLTDIKVVSLSKTHTAHKCVIPVELRGQPIRIRPPIASIPPSAPSVPSVPAKSQPPAKARPVSKPVSKAPPAKAKAKAPARTAAKKPATKRAPKKR
jgi:hypothetical protein